MKIIISALFVFLLISDTLTAQTQMSVIIGKQEWMIKNLDVAAFRNGEPIPEAKTGKEWLAYAQAGEAAWCYYDNDPANGAKYGKLYNWYAVADPRNVCPTGWHVPTDVEWSVLINHLDPNADGGFSIPNKAGAKMKAKEGWAEEWEKEGNGTNSSGFTGLPAGIRDGDGAFYLGGDGGSWWSSSEFDAFKAWVRYLYYSNGNASTDFSNKASGFSVRCLRD
jgi:uncharacterized protein (TIGR02145 family)